jgi:hypothetical protein
MRRLLMAALLASGCFRPQVPSGKVICAANSDCPGGLTCQVTDGDPYGPRRCCGPSGCPALASDGPATPADASPPRADGSLVSPPDVSVGTMTPVPDGGPAGTPDGPAPAPVDAPPPGPDLASMVSCAQPVTSAPPVAANRKSYCTIGVQDTRVMLNIDVVDNNDPLTISSYQICQLPLDLAARTAPLPGQGSAALGAADVDLVARIVGYYHSVCTQLQVDSIVGAYATGWARQASNAAAIQSAVSAASTMNLEVLTPEQETAQRYLGAARNHRRDLVVHARGSDLLVTSWPDAAAGPTETVVPTNLRVADDRFFGNNNYPNYLQARRAYEDALENDLNGPLNDWRQQMNRGGLVDNLIFDPDDATFVLAVHNGLRSGNNTWDDAETFKKKLAAAQSAVMMTAYGWGYGVLRTDELSRFPGTIFADQFQQLRAEPVKSAYGLEVMALTGFMDVFTRRLPIGEVGVVLVNASYGYVFRKAFTPQ